MNQRLRNEEIRRVAEQYAHDELYRAVSSIGPQLEYELSGFGLCAEECFMEVLELLSAIAEKGERFLPEAEGRWLSKYNEYRRIARNGHPAGDDELRKVVGIVFGFAVLALGGSRYRFYRYTLAERLMQVVANHQFEGWSRTLDQIFSVPLSDEWFDAFLDKEPEAETGDIMLPAEIDTPRAKEYFVKAVEMGWMIMANGKYVWKGIGTNSRGKQSQLAYFLGKVYNYKHNISGNAGESFPEGALNELFGLDSRTRLYSSLTQVYNAQKPQRWREKIDSLFE